MEIGRLQQLMEHAQRLLQDTPHQIQEFEQVLQQIESQQTAGAHPSETLAATQTQETATPQVSGTESSPVDRLYVSKKQQAQTPEGLKNLVQEIEHHYGRLQQLIQTLESGRTFSPQELLGIQAQMHELTMQIEVTTKVVSEVVSGIKQLLQQQV